MRGTGWSLMLVLLVSTMSTGSGQQGAASQLPNGDTVPNPCQPNTTWPGVAYLTVAGGGALNAFGKDLEAAGSWTAALCQMDSDGDGLTNGQELGDPGCTWVLGATPQTTTGITHPGICEPLDSAACGSRPVPATHAVPFTTQREWMDDVCSHHCAPMDATQDVRIHALRPSFQVDVPAKETTYTCATYSFPDVSADYHVIATEPVINNTIVMHHMLVYGCTGDTDLHGPQTSCDFNNCGQLLVAWGVGVSGYCLNAEAGIRVGKTGFKKFMIQSHWNNPQEVDSYTDSSGMKLYYTPHIRPSDQGMMMLGATYLEIPPASTDVAISSDCTAACTSNLMSGDVHVTLALNHMHLLGIAMRVELLRNGQHVTYITNDAVYNYDAPGFYTYTDPVLVKPGDVLRTTCHYANPHNTTVFYGEGTQEEMCFGFLSFYPLQNMPQSQCTTWKSVSNQACDIASYAGCDPRPYMHDLEHTSLYTQITSVCEPFDVCRKECLVAIQHAMLTEPCMISEDNWFKMKQHVLRNSEAGWKLLASIESCEGPVPMAAATQHPRSHVGDGRSPIIVG